jgi:hypothetical protein
MACQMVVFDTETKSKSTYTCDEADAERLVSDDHVAKGPGEYTDVKTGQKFSVDWTKARLISFARKQ